MNAETTAIVKTAIDIVRNAHLPTTANDRALLRAVRFKMTVGRGLPHEGRVRRPPVVRLREKGGSSCPRTISLRGLLQQLLNRAAAPPAPPPTEPETEEGSSELSSGILRERFEAILQRQREPLPPIHQPTPACFGRQEDLFPDFKAASTPPVVPGPLHPLVRFVYYPMPSIAPATMDPHELRSGWRTGPRTRHSNYYI